MAGFSSPLAPLCLWWLVNTCGAVWRYETSTGDYFIFSTRTVIYLQFEGTTFVEWDAPPLCSLVDKSKPETLLVCPVPGTHQIRPVVTVPSPDDEARFLSIIADVNCFMWYIYQDTSRLLDSDSTQFIHAWIFDPENAEDSETTHTAVSPSVYSKTLTKQFWNWGESPAITTFFGRKVYTDVQYKDGIWTLEVPSLTNDNIALFYGKAVTFQDCFILDTPFVIAQPKLHLDAQGYTITSPAGSLAKVTWAACFPSTAVLLTDFGVFYTSDAFLTSEELKIPADIIDRAIINDVKDVAIAFPDVFILIKDIVYKASEGEVIKLGSNQTVPDSGIIGIQAKTWCSAEYPLINKQLSELLIWTDEEIVRGLLDYDFHLLADTGVIKESLNLRRDLDLVIVSACYDSLITLIAILIQCTGCLGTDILYLVTYNEALELWSLGDFVLDPPKTGVMFMEVLSSAKKSMVLWDNDKIFYTYKDNKDYGFLNMSGTSTPFSAAAEGSAIHQIIIDYSGNTLVKLNNNALYFFKFEMKEVVKLAAWENRASHFVFYWKPSGDMYLLKIDGGTIDRQTYPLRLEVFSAAWKLGEVCPYISFEHNMKQNIYYLDMGEKIAFWTQIVFLENLGLSVNIEIFNSHLLKQNTYLHYEIARGICTKNQTVTFYHDADYSVAFDYETVVTTAQGVMTVEFQPSLSGKTCDSKIKLTHLRVVFSLKKGSVKLPILCCLSVSFLWVFYRSSLRNNEKDLEINYKVEEYGCPIEVDYRATFRPTVLLYMSNNPLGTVEANYIVWEVNDRIDFEYNSTMEEVHCLTTAQSWEQMIGNNTKTSSLSPTEIDSLWGPHNYKSCFITYVEDLRNLDEPYEILNHSGINSITWPQYHTGIYMFRLKIVDPNFSFCNLNALFAVRTYGIVKRPHWFLIAGWATMIVILFLGVLVYSYFRYVKTFRELNFTDPLMFDQDLNTTDSADEEGKEI
ncbi:cation channel sperm-associated protein subunit epsilon [Sceloporus undulatus]|uniref:cation channel sperm-associated protein subunit epsilon n=1 Tax=Sceloporus undulatus TaxID=8520 RepID=UPI001C4CB156|nr:cation channel sperm-associated protein subunit epsilon [Sceloporus undulatus]